ncbi:hypothetical protein [Sphingomonas faeni]|uniref:hypothetical protein n=1 Tax=Sphingomonas faeni TaxID=185950 RepID=UPI002412EBE0|nr:hypothetical protein [Sphingomonas faeni]
MRYFVLKYASDRCQNFAILITGMSAIAILYAKAVLANYPATAAFISFEYFYNHLNKAGLWSYIYWTDAGAFITSLLMAIVLQHRIANKKV